MPRTPALALFFAAAASLVWLTACTGKRAAPEPVRAVRTVTVQSQTVGGAREYAGEIRARTESTLGFRVAGKMLRRLVDVGDTVQAGQTLAQIDPRDLALAQDAARAQLNAAEARYNQATADLRRFKELRDQGFIGAAEFDRRSTESTSARAQRDQARAQAKAQVNQAAYAALIADANGVVTQVDAEPGAVLAAGTPVLRVARDGPRDVVFSVPEDQVDQLKAQAAQPAAFKVRLWGVGGAQRDARVREIAASADPATRTFLVKADLLDAGAGAGAGAVGTNRSVVRLGQTATVTMQLPPSDGMTKLPLSALKEDGGRTVVWLVEPTTMTVRTQAVQLGAADGNEAVITGGLKPGAVVVSAGVHVLSAGQKVTFYRDPSAASLPAGPTTVPPIEPRGAPPAALPSAALPRAALPSALAASAATAR